MVLGDLLYLLIIISLLLLFSVSLGLFIKRRTKNQSIKTESLRNIEEKLDRLIEVLEKKRTNIIQLTGALVVQQ
ncbi:hypothetical protein GCM10007380_09130 [Gottfriedia solisilvae]|uniref:Uncharacterized protein n=1 Tax=Gottfriedia solisilvae TaxID=1516104 RepID=A0A8J3AFL5_9BACI|nr:hypothetical protein GCM10007380_09130 [Gottfriedia solisilvae]